MFRLTKALICNTMQRSTQPAFIKTIQLMTAGNGRGLAQRVEHSFRGPLPRSSTRQTEEEKNKITAWGWFLLLIPATTFTLGCWQVKRKAWKEQLIKDMEKLTTMPAVPIPQDLTELNNMEYRLVRLCGQFLHDKEMYVGPRSLIRADGVETSGGLFSQRDTGNGYLVITPFKLADKDEIVLVNRGWVSRKHMKPETRTEGQVTKDVELTCVVRKGEQRPQFTPDHKGEIYLYRDLPKMCKESGALPIFLDATYDSTIPGGPIGGQTRVTLHNDHLSYLITWYSLTAATAYLWYRQVLQRRPF